VCGRRIRSDGTFAAGRHRKLHPEPCAAWGSNARLGDETWETPVLAQVAGMRLDDATIAGVVAALGGARQPIAIDRARVERQMRELALEHVRGVVGDEVYLERMKELRSAQAVTEETVATRVSAERAVDWLRVIADTWREADVPEAKAELLHAI
jgi:hypothetical protein